MHADALGVRQHACGSALRDLCEEGRFGEYPTGPGSGTWNDKLDGCLRTAYLEFEAWLGVHKLTCSQPQFTSLTLTLHSSVGSACLKAKGRNCVTVSQWLLSVLEPIAIANPGDRLAQHRLGLFHGLVGLWTVPHEMRPRFILTDDEKRNLELYRCCVLASYYFLHCQKARSGKVGYSLVPKLHQVDHMVRRSLRCSISYHIFWCFRAEDFMGSIAKLAGQTHGATTIRRVVERWLVQFSTWLQEDL